jgi:hypothetical protein
METPEVPRAQRGGPLSGTDRGDGRRYSRIVRASSRPTRLRFQNANRVPAARHLLGPVSGRLEAASDTNISLRIEQILTAGWATPTVVEGRWRHDSGGERVGAHSDWSSSALPMEAVSRMLRSSD